MRRWLTISAIDDLLDDYYTRDALGYHDDYMSDNDFDSETFEYDPDYNYERREWIR